MNITNNQPPTTSSLAPLITSDSSNLSTTPQSFKEASLVDKVIRVLLVLFLIIFSFGLILCAYSFRDLLDIDTATQAPSGPADRLLAHVEDALSGPVPTWDNEHLFQHSCLMYEKYGTVLPLNIFAPLTKFNCVEHICNCLLAKQILEQCGECDLPCPPTCTPENYYQLLREACVFPFILWHDPHAHTQEAMLAKMEQNIRSGRVGNSHWALIIVDICRRCVTYFDSLYDFVWHPEQTQAQLNELASALGNIYPEGESNTPFQTCIGSTFQVQPLGELSCGVWCCQFLEWYLENPDFSLEDKVPVSVCDRKSMLTRFCAASQASMSKYSALNWPSH